MRFYLDSEFVEDGLTIDLISIGIVAEDGRELYIENSDCDLGKACDWVKENVIPHLYSSKDSQFRNALYTVNGNVRGVLSHKEIGPQVLSFLNPKESKPEIWTYYGGFDMVVFAQLFGKMIDLPDGLPMFDMDLKQWSVQLGDPELPTQTSTEHNSLSDAKHNQVMWEFLNNLSNNK